MVATGDSTVVFNATSGSQIVDNAPWDFANVISSNTSSSGLTFTSSFTAKSLTVDAAGLGNSATIYFHGTSTFTISTFTMIGTAANHVVLKSTSSDQWYLNVTSSQTARYVEVSSSNANPGLTMCALAIRLAAWLSKMP